MTDFFVSYNSHDRHWAEWIAWELEEQGFDVVIQAWDFTGNWILKMVQAMREATRTIAVLSPHYVKADFTQSEWANAFRLDPRGEKDLLIPVRVEPVELDATLAQLVYVDFVGLTEEEASDLLLKRVRRERGKPATSPNFPGGHSSEDPAQRSIAKKPAFPGAAEDEQKLRRVREIVIGWRGLYSDKVESLRKASELARKWSYEPPSELTDEVVQVITLAATAARDFQALPLHELEFAKSYDLKIHPTVFWGQALSDAFHQASHIDPKVRAARAAFNKELKERGLPQDDDVPDKYGFEMLARVLESALALARFDIGNLPRGYLGSADQSISADLRAYKNLLVATIDNEPGLQLISVDVGIERIGSFVARKLFLSSLCAQRNEDGSLDLVAQDSQNLYYWLASSHVPTMQFPQDDYVLDARFLSPAPGAVVATVNDKGAVTLITAEGKSETVSGPLGERGLKEARIWVDPLDKEDWYVVALTDEFDVISGPRGVFSTNRSGEDFWNEPVFLTEFDGIVHWNTNGWLTLGTLESLPCLIVVRQAFWGVGVCFLDPKTLGPIRRPLVIREFAGDMTIASGRWLVVGLLSQGRDKDRIMVWDLNADGDEPVGSWFKGKGDVYSPVVVAETSDSFQTVQIFREFNSPSGQDFQLCRFHWPSGNVETLERFTNLRLWHTVST